MDFSLIKVPQFLDNAVSPPAKEIGQTLANIFYFIFSPINYNVERLKVKHVENLKKYEKDIQDELDKIPEHKLTEPPMSIVGPALEASKYYINNVELRKMFAKLIASSMNSDTTYKTHNSFVEIIKQLSPIDAQNLQLISSSKALPIVKYRVLLNDDSNGGINVLTHVFLSNENIQDIDPYPLW